MPPLHVERLFEISWSFTLRTVAITKAGLGRGVRSAIVALTWLRHVGTNAEARVLLAM